VSALILQKHTLPAANLLAQNATRIKASAGIKANGSNPNCPLLQSARANTPHLPEYLFASESNLLLRHSQFYPFLTLSIASLIYFKHKREKGGILSI